MFSGALASYVYYDSLHWFYHHGHGGSRSVGRARHMRHHFSHASPTRDYGVTTRLWDMVFGTCGNEA